MSPDHPVDHSTHSLDTVNKRLGGRQSRPTHMIDAESSTARSPCSQAAGKRPLSSRIVGCQLEEKDHALPRNNYYTSPPTKRSIASSCSTRSRNAAFSTSSSCALACFLARHLRADKVFCNLLRSVAVNASCGMSSPSSSPAAAPDSPLLGEADDSLAVCCSFRRFAATLRSPAAFNRLRDVAEGKSVSRFWIGASRAMRGMQGSRKPVGAGRAACSAR